jgi:hypothetical protein
MNQPEKPKPQEAVPDGTTGKSSVEHFDNYSAAVPDEIRGDPEILPPEAEPVETGWPVWNIQQIATLPFYVLGKRYGDQWALDSEESLKFATAWKPLFDRWLPTEQSDLGMALLVTLAIVAPRVISTDWEAVKKREGKKEPNPKESTKTAGSTASPSSSGNAKAEKVPEWEPFAAASGA